MTLLVTLLLVLGLIALEVYLEQRRKHGKKKDSGRARRLP